MTTSITVHNVAVVACFSCIHNVVAAACRRAVATAGIACGVGVIGPVIALLPGVDNPVATHRQQAITLAAVGVDVIPVVAFLAGVDNVVTAGGRRAIRPASVRYGVRVVRPVVALLTDFEDAVAAATERRNRSDE